MGVTPIAIADEPRSPVTVLHTFLHFRDSKQPINLIKGRDGNFYGETIGEPEFDFGSIFRISPAGDFKTLHFFHDPLLGDFPLGPLLEASDGNFYGTTSNGGTFGRGILFRMTPDGQVTVLHDFGSSDRDGASPWAGLVQSRDGKLYGTTMDGGSNGAGIVYRATLAGQITVVHNFALNLVATGSPVPPAPGARSPSNLVEGRDGQFYGVTESMSTLCTNGICDIGDYGTVFRLSKNGAYKALYRFPPPSKFDSTSGYGPVAPLMQASDGNFYGTTQYGSGEHSAGTVFRMTPAGKVAFIHDFHQAPKGSGLPQEGSNPTNPMVEGPDGLLYSTVAGCLNGVDCLYRMDHDGARFEILHNFANEEAMSPNALIWDDGRIYASAQGGGLIPGGIRGDGSVFSYEPSPSPGLAG